MDTQLDAELRAKTWLKRCVYSKILRADGQCVEYSSNAMINEELKDAVIHDLVLLNLVGVKVVVIWRRAGDFGYAERIARSPALSACATPTARPWISCRWCCAARSTRIIIEVFFSKRRAAAAFGLGGMDGGTVRAKRLTDRTGTDYGYVGDIVEGQSGTGDGCCWKRAIFRSSRPSRRE